VCVSIYTILFPHSVIHVHLQNNVLAEIKNKVNHS